MKISTRSIKHIMSVELLTQADLAEKAGVSRATINTALLKGACSTLTIKKIAKALGVEPVVILESEE